ncbi:MAG: zinc-binding dehydrogenase [Gammaproteobacteria bacterium]|nr:zinc-binding dehydrogenase [Gammaproteobacteria bacterium]MCY4255845.1 zinc-binding dehydrogenase [Gammaproteobacteria bacterium]
MHGFLVEEFGGTEVMRWRELGALKPGARQVLVEVKASGVNFAETRMRAGTYSGQELPFVMGMECAGIVAECGRGVCGFKPGDRVFGRARGSHAEAVLFDADHLMPLPESVSFVQGAAIPVSWLTAWHALHAVAGMRKGQRVLIEAVASGVGSAALQIAKWAGCWVAGTASRNPKLDIARQWGADAAYNYKHDDVPALVRRDTDRQGIDIGLMTIGEETAQSLIDCMGMDGRIVMYGSTGGRQVCFNLNIGTRNLALMSMSISTSARFLSDTMPRFREVALPLFAEGAFRAPVGPVLPLSEVAKAHQLIDERNHFGKIILTPDRHSG